MRLSMRTGSGGGKSSKSIDLLHLGGGSKSPKSIDLGDLGDNAAPALCDYDADSIFTGIYTFTYTYTFEGEYPLCETHLRVPPPMHYTHTMSNNETRTYKSSATLVMGDTFRHVGACYTVLTTPTMEGERYVVSTNKGTLRIPASVPLRIV